MSGVRFISESELESLYSPEDHNRIANLLNVQSELGRSELKESIFRIARAYDAGLIEAAGRPYDSETRESLQKIRKLARSLTLALEGANHHARSDVAWALSKTRKERKLSSGEPVVPYGQKLTNEWIFDRESFAAFVAGLVCLDVHLEARVSVKVLGRGGRPRRPEQLAIKDLEKVWKARSDKRDEAVGSFIKLCELTLRPVAARHGQTPDIVAPVKNALYGLELKPGPWEV